MLAQLHRTRVQKNHRTSPQRRCQCCNGNNSYLQEDAAFSHGILVQLTTTVDLLLLRNTSNKAYACCAARVSDCAHMLRPAGNTKQHLAYMNQFLLFLSLCAECLKRAKKKKKSLPSKLVHVKKITPHAPATTSVEHQNTAVY